jgi:hypothetical protein
MEGRRRLASQ